MKKSERPKSLADQQTAEAQRKAEEAAKAAGNTDHLGAALSGAIREKLRKSLSP